MLSPCTRHRIWVVLAPAFAVAWVGCGGSSSTLPPDGGNGPADATMDAGGGTLDAGADASTGVDAAAHDGGGGVADGAVDAAGASTIPYDHDGPVAYTHQVERLMNGASSFTVTEYLPSSPGLHPAVVLSCGTSQTAAGYVPYAQRLASYGIAMFMMDDPGVGVNTSDVYPNVVYLVDTYLPANFASSIDVTKIGLSGHSRGGGVSLLAAEHLQGKVVAWFGLDPADNEFLMAPRDFARTNLPDIGIPTAFLGAGVTSNCAPPADSYETLFPLAPSPSTLIIGVGAGHTELEVASGCTACYVCYPAGTADPNVVLAYAVRYLTAFFARELLGDTAVGAHFEGAGGPEDIAAGRVTIM